MTRVHRTTVTENGQITLPEVVRERLRAVDGTQLEFVLEGSTVTVRNPDAAVDPLDVWFGVMELPEEQTVTDWIREMRDGDGQEDSTEPQPGQRILYLLPDGTLSPERP